MHFSELMNFAIDFDQLFVRIFENFWYQSIRRPQENVFLLGAKFKINFETILHDLLLHKGHFNQIEVIKRTSWPPTQKCYNNYTLLSNRQLTAKLARVNFYSHLWYFNSQNWCFFALCSDLFNCHCHKHPIQTIA